MAAAAVRGRRMRPGERTGLWVTRVVVWFVVLLVYFPIWSILVASLLAGGAFSTTHFFPDKPTLDNYAEVLTCPGAQRCFPLWLKNTVLIGIIVGIVQVLTIATSAFAFSRLRFWGRRYGIAALWVIQTMPTFMALPAIFGILVLLGLDNNFWGLVLINLGTSVFFVWLMKGYLDGIPRELDEAAAVDGATTWQTFWRIIIPLSRPMLAVLFLFNFMAPFGEYIVTSLVNKDPDLYTIPIGLKLFVQNAFATRWGVFSAAVLLTAVPLAIIWGVGQRYVQSGLTRGAVKG
jgi:arabinogalactan oligomer/maltooligosaccharide transport system permease protein